MFPPPLQAQLQDGSPILPKRKLCPSAPLVSPSGPVVPDSSPTTLVSHLVPASHPRHPPPTLAVPLLSMAMWYPEKRDVAREQKGVKVNDGGDERLRPVWGALKLACLTMFPTQDLVPRDNGHSRPHLRSRVDLNQLPIVSITSRLQVQ